MKKVDFIIFLLALFIYCKRNKKNIIKDFRKRRFKEKMSFIKNRSIGGKLGILVTIPLVLMIAITIYNYSAYHKIDDRYTYVYTNFDVNVAKWAEFRSNLRAIQEDIGKIIMSSKAEQMKMYRDDIESRRAANDKFYNEYKSKAGFIDGEKLDC